MIQRIQSLWLLIVAIAAFATYTLKLYIGTNTAGTEIIFPLAENLILVIVIIALGILAMVSIFLYKNRKLQFKLAIFGIIFSVGFLFLEYYAVESFKTERQIQSGSYQLGALLPILMVFLFFFAARGIYRDERLIKSMDRLR